MAPSLELALAVECCRVAFTPGEAPFVPLPAELDWPLFLRVVRFHGVQALAWHALAARRHEIPGDVADALANDAAAIAAANLRSAVACGGLLEDFTRAGVDVLFLKGLTLARLAYGNATIKAAIDIDLLVAEERLVEAARMLEERGYRLVYPDTPGTPDRLRSWHRVRKESVWLRAGERVHIDLHTRLSDNRALIPSLDVHSSRRSVEVAKGISLPTLGQEELFAYLCVHGASSAWFRLKWIADLAALIHRCGGDELDRLYGRSQQLGAGRAAGQAVLLADTLFHSLGANPALRKVLNNDGGNRWLCNAAFRQLASRTEPVEPTEQRFGTATIHLSQLRLLPGMRFKLSELARQIRVGL